MIRTSDSLRVNRWSPGSRVDRKGQRTRLERDKTDSHREVGVGGKGAKTGPYAVKVRSKSERESGSGSRKIELAVEPHPVRIVVGPTIHCESTTPAGICNGFATPCSPRAAHPRVLRPHGRSHVLDDTPAGSAPGRTEHLRVTRDQGRAFVHVARPPVPTRPFVEHPDRWCAASNPTSRDPAPKHPPREE